MASIFEDLATECKNKLDFRYKDLTNVSRPGKPPRGGDDIKFTAYAKNYSSSISMKNIVGVITNAAATNFNPVTFSIPSLAPGEEKQIAIIEANDIIDSNDINIMRFKLDSIAKVSQVIGEVDMSVIKFTDSDIFFTRILPD